MAFALSRGAQGRQFLDDVRAAAFSTIYSITHDASGQRVGAHLHSVIPLVLLVVRVVQLCSFALSRELGFAWHEGWTDWLQVFFGAARLDPLLVGDSIDDTVTFAALLPTIAVVAAWLALLVYTWRSVVSTPELCTAAKARGFLDACRTSSTVVTSVLYIPILSILLRTNRCTSDSSLTCWGTEHTALAVLGDLTAAIFVPVAYFLYTMMPSRKPASMNAGTRQYEVSAHAVAHTRLHQVEFTASTLLVLVFSLLSSTDGSDRWLAAITTFVCVGSIAGSCLYYLPFYHFRSNVQYTVAYWLAAWVSACLLVVQINDDPTQRVASVMLFGCVPLVVLLAAFCCLARRYIIQHKSVSSLSSFFELELLVRFMLQNKVAAWNDEQTLEDGDVDADAKVRLLAADSGVSSRQALDMGEEMFGELAQLYQTGSRRFHTSALLQVFVSQFYQHYIHNEHVAARMLARAEERQPSLDVEYYTYEQRRETQDARSKHKDSSLVMDYMRFVQRYEDAREMHVVAYRNVLEFWTEMLRDEPDMTRLDALGGEMSMAVGEAHQAYQEVMRLNRNSGKVMASYAQFVGTLLNDEEQGKSLETRAAELLRHNGERMVQDDDADPTSRIFDDATGVVTISGELDSPGVILSVNDAVCDLLGRLRGELIGSNISTIMSNPFSSLHDNFITRFQNTGKGVVIDRTRTLYALHKNGFLIPVTLTVKQLSGGLSKSVFIGILSEAKLSFKEHAALVNTTTGQIIRSTSGAARLLGLSLGDIIDGLNTEIAHFLPEFRLHVPKDQVMTSTVEADRQANARELRELRKKERDKQERRKQRRERRRRRVKRKKKEVQQQQEKERKEKQKRKEKRKRKRKRKQGGPMTLTVDYSETRAVEDESSSESSTDSGSSSSDEDEQVKPRLGLMTESGTDEGSAPEAKEDSPPARGIDRYRTAAGREVSLKRGSVEHVVQVWVQRLDFMTVSVDVVRIVEKDRFVLDSNGERVVEDGSDVSGSDMSMSDVSSEVSSLRSDYALDMTTPLGQRDTLDSETGARLASLGQRDTLDSETRAQLVSLSRRDPDPAPGANVSIRISEDARSQVSKGSGGSGQSSMSSVLFRQSVSQIRSMLLSQSTGMDSSMRLFSVAFMLTVAILVVMGIVGAVVSSNAFVDFEEHVIEIELSGGRRTAALEMYSLALQLNLILAGHDEPHTVEHAQEVQAQLKATATQLQSDMVTLYLDKSDLSAEHLRLYNYPSVSVLQLEEETERVLKVGLVQAATLLASNALFVAEDSSPLVSLTMDNEHMFFVQANAVENVVPPFNTSTYLVQESARRSADAVDEVQIILLCVSLGVLFLMMVGVFVPTIRRVERTRRSVYDMFLGVKVNHVRALEQEARAQLVALGGVEALDGDWESDDAGSDGAADEAEHEHRHKKKKKKGRTKRQYRNVGNRTNQLLRKVSFLFLLACAYFATVFVLESELISQSVSRLPELNWASQRRYFAHAAFVATRDVLAYPHTASDSTNRRQVALPQLVEKAREAVGTARLVNQALLFSNPALDLHEPSIKRYAARDELTYGDACRVLGDVEACSAFNDGVLTLGMDTALEDFLSRCSSLVSHVEALAGYNDTTSMRALLNGDEFATLAEYDSVWLKRALDLAAAMFEDEESDGIDAFVSVRTAMLSVFLSLCVLLFVLVYRPMIKRLDADLKQTRGMLLMVPLHIMAATPAIKKGLEKARW